MTIYFLWATDPKDIHNTLKKIHIQLRRKEKFHTYFNPGSTLLLEEDDNYTDIFSYQTEAGNTIVGGLLDCQQGEPPRERFQQFLLEVQQKGSAALQYIVIGSPLYQKEDWQEVERLCLLKALCLEGDWAPLYKENLSYSIITDDYKNIILTQLNRHFM